MKRQRDISEEERDRKYKKRKLCIGGREHDYLLCLPSYVRHETSVLGVNVANTYYEIMDELSDAHVHAEKQLEAIGVTRALSPWYNRRSRSYICSRCSKHHHD